MVISSKGHIIEIIFKYRSRISILKKSCDSRDRKERKGYEQHIVGRNLTSISRKGSARSKTVPVFSSIFDTWFDTQYLTGPDVCLWTRSKDHEQPFFFYFSRVIVDRLSYLIILHKRRCRMRAKKEEREGEGGSRNEKEYVYFQWSSCYCWYFDEIMPRLVSFLASFLLSFFSLWFFDSNPHSSIRSTILFTNGTKFRSRCFEKRYSKFQNEMNFEIKMMITLEK